jgi:hypothetical protein
VCLSTNRILQHTSRKNSTRNTIPHGELIL